MKRRKRRKRKGKKRDYLERAGVHNRHHILPKSRRGGCTVHNLIWLDERRHSAFHLLFGLRTFEEASNLLMRAYRAKKNQKEVN